MKRLMMLAASVLVVSTLSAYAQTVSVGHTATVSAPGVKAAHADQVSATVEDGNLTVSGGVAHGFRAGDTKGQAGANATLSVPVPTPSQPVPVPTPAQALAPLAAPISIAKKIFRF